MLVSHRHRFIYTKTTKTAGTSVESFFERFCMTEGTWTFQHAREEYVSEAGIIGYRGVDASGKQWFNHMAAETIRAQLGEEIWGSYFKFAVIRDPFDKVVSGYFFATQANGEAADIIADFRRWLGEGGAASVMDRHNYVIDGALCLDYFIRYEALLEGIQSVCERVGVDYDATSLPRLKAEFRQRDIPLADFYDAAAIAAVEDCYGFELEQFGYRAPC